MNLPNEQRPAGPDSAVEREDPALALSSSPKRAGRLQIVSTFALAAGIILVLIYGLNNQHPLDGTPPEAVASASGAAPPAGAEAQP
jgi:hypothetical protein